MNFDRYIIAVMDWNPSECNLLSATVSNSGLNITYVTEQFGLYRHKKLLNMEMNFWRRSAEHPKC